MTIALIGSAALLLLAASRVPRLKSLRKLGAGFGEWIVFQNPSTAGSAALVALLDTREALASELAERMAQRQDRLDQAGRVKDERPRSGPVETLKNYLRRLVRRGT